MRGRASFVALIALSLSPVAAEARTVCGPGAARTLASSAEARVYISGESVRACHIKRRSGYRLGAASKVIDAQVVGRYASVRGRVSRGQSLRVFDLRRARPESVLRRYRRVRLVKLDASGVAAVYAVGSDGRDVVTSSDGGVFARPDSVVEDIGMRGAVVGYRIGGVAVLQNYYETEFETVRKTTDGTLFRVGDVRLTATGVNVTARKGSGKRVALGSPGVTRCNSRSTCSGWGSIQIAGDRVVRATLDVGINRWVDVFDLAAGTSSRLCPGEVLQFVVSQSGKVACAQNTPPSQILVEGVVVDSGPGIAMDSLQQRGDQFVWFNGGVERTAAIPPRA